MAFYRTLISSLRRHSNTRHRLLSSHFYSDAAATAAASVATSTASSFSSSSLPFSTFALRCGSSHIPLPFSRWPSFPHLSGPLFLSSPPWKLSQSATPLYLRGKDGIFPADLLQVRSFPLDLVALRPAGGIGKGNGDAVVWSPEEAVVKVLEKDKFLNLPNLISISRMVSGPAIAWLIIHDMYLPAFGALVLAGATDWLDGFLARKMAVNSVFGSYLDPLADKVLIGFVALAMVEKDLLHPGLVSLVVLRDVALVSGALYKRASSLGWEWKSWSEFTNLDATFQKKVEPLFISKVNTVFQLLLVAAALLQPELGSEHTQIYISYLSWLVASTTIASSVGYGLQHLRHK